MAPRIAWYALGGGLGHLNRALAILRHLRPLTQDAGYLLLASTPHVHLAVAAGVPVLRLPGAMEGLAFPKGATGLLAAQALATLSPLDLLVVDTFADGLHLELTPEVLGLARRKALIYREGGVLPLESPGWPLYDRIFAPYPVTPDPDALAMGTVVNRLPHEALAKADARRRLGLPETGTGPLVVAMHAGDPGEVLGFFAQVRAAARLLGPHELRLVTPLPLPGEPWPEVVHVYPASEVLPAADLVVAGAGYNTHAELTLFGKRALYRPFNRTHDTQSARLGALDRVFGPLTPPEELAELMRLALSLPEPPQPDVRDYDGAKRIATELAHLAT